METIVLKALHDPDDGVVGRAAHVAGVLKMGVTAERLGELVTERPALSYHAMIAISQLDDDQARLVAHRIKSLPEAQSEPEALATTCWVCSKSRNPRLEADLCRK